MRAAGACYRPAGTERNRGHPLQQETHERKLVADLGPITRRQTGPSCRASDRGLGFPRPVLRGGRRVRAVWVAMLAVAVATALALLASPAGAFGEHGGTETSMVTVPGPGNASTETDQLPAAATQGELSPVLVGRSPGQAGGDFVRRWARAVAESLAPSVGPSERRVAGAGLTAI
jgi:hypothetical protein